jgi:hypothetical protein
LLKPNEELDIMRSMSIEGYHRASKYMGRHTGFPVHGNSVSPGSIAISSAIGELHEIGTFPNGQIDHTSPWMTWPGSDRLCGSGGWTLCVSVILSEFCPESLLQFTFLHRKRKTGLSFVPSKGV